MHRLISFSGQVYIANTNSLKIRKQMIPPTPRTSPYYTPERFYHFSPLAILYSAISHLGLLLLHPTPWRFKPAQMPAMALPVTSNKDDGIPRKLAIVTGSNTGVGFETAKYLVNDYGFDVILACRSRDKGLSAANKINEEVSRCSTDSHGKAIFLHPLDLCDFDSVKEFSTQVQKKYDNVDVLVNNAGLNSSAKTKEGLDSCFKTNFLGHFLLTNLLMPALLKCQGSRVVNLSSVTHHFVEEGMAEEEDEKGGYLSRSWWTKQATYGQSGISYRTSKLASILFSMELNKRFGSKGLQSIAVNPGSVNSDIWRGYPRWIIPIFRMIYLTSKQGSSTSVAAAVGEFPKVQKDKVLYLQPYRQLFSRKAQKPPFPAFEMLGPYVGCEITTPRLPSDGGPKSAQALWEVSQQLCAM